MQEPRTKATPDITHPRLCPDMREGGTETKPRYGTIKGGVGHF
jgi:hypothetical protein